MHCKRRETRQNLLASLSRMRRSKRIEAEAGVGRLNVRFACRRQCPLLAQSGHKVVIGLNLIHQRVRIPTPEQEEAKRLHRERRRLVHERGATRPRHRGYAP